MIGVYTLQLLVISRPFLSYDLVEVPCEALHFGPGELAVLGEHLGVECYAAGYFFGGLGAMCKSDLVVRVVMDHRMGVPGMACQSTLSA